MKTNIRYFILGSILMINGIGMAQWDPGPGYVYPTTTTDKVVIGSTTAPIYPMQVNSGLIVGSLSSHSGDSLRIGISHTEVAFMGVTKVNSSSPPRNAVFGTSQVLSDIIFANRVNNTYDYYERMRINRFGRVGIGTPTPDTSALLDVSSTNKGLLIPRVALTATNDGTTIPLPATSLLVYNTNGGLSPSGYWYNAGSSSSPNWVQLISSATAGAWLLTGNSVSSGDFIGTTNAQDFIVKTFGSERMRVLAGGNVGIGTSSPGGTLSIVSTNTTGTTTSSSLNVSANSLTTGTGVYAGSSSLTSGYLSNLVISGTTAANNQRALNISLTGANSSSSVSTYGEVIINGHTGTSSTNFGLYSEAKDATTNYAVFGRANGSNASNIGLYTNVSGGTSNYNLYLSTLAAGANNYSLYSPALAKSYFAGNVGIGTTNPSTLLHISGNGAFTFDPTPVTSAYTTAFVMDDTGLKIGHNGSNRDMRLQTNSSTKMTILSGGDVGIGLTNPAYKLDVTGDIHNTGIMAVGMGQFSTYRLTINGSGYASSGTWDTSDEQFKTDIDSLQNALTIIKQLKPKTYYFDTANVYGLNLSEKKQYGFLAQEIEQILPEVVKMGTKEADLDTLGNVVHPAITFKTMNYTELIAILTKGIQELHQKNDSLKTEMNNQGVANSALQEQVNQLQNQVNQLVANGTSTQDQLNQLLDAVNNCCSATRSMQIGSDDTQSQEIRQTDVKLQDAKSLVLQQNVPNPFKEKTTINYTLPETYMKAQLLFYNSQGKLIQSVELTGNGNGQLNVFADDLSSGIYTYTLVVDGKIIETKKMMKQ